MFGLFLQRGVCFGFFPGLGAFPEKNATFLMVKSLFGSTSRHSMKLVPKEVLRHDDQGQVALGGASSLCITAP